jgi:rod shape-determining protein MreD
MNYKRIFSISGLLIAIFILQVAGFSELHLPFGGLSIYLISLIVLISVQQGKDCLIVGFLGGIIYDLNPSFTTPMGQWALIFTIIGYLFMSYKSSLLDIMERPLAGLSIFALTMFIVLSLNEILSAIFGNNLGSLSYIIYTMLAAMFWTVLISPIILPGLERFSNMLTNSKEKL